MYFSNEELDGIYTQMFEKVSEVEEIFNTIVRITRAEPELTIETPRRTVSVAPKPTLSTTLILPDAHVKPGEDCSRFKALNNLIEEKRPTNICGLGDFLTMSSLSHWDKNNRLKMEGIRYKEDINAGKEALSEMFRFVLSSDSYNPNIVWCLGNHDDSWISRYLEQNPQLAGHIDLINDLGLRSTYGINNIVPYKKYYEIEGVLFTHAPQNGASSPVGGKYAAQKASELTAKSLVFGHTHALQQYNCQRHGDTNLIQIYTAGCFFEEPEEYAEDGTMPHWAGISVLHHWGYGRFDVEQISLERLKAEYL